MSGQADSISLCHQLTITLGERTLLDAGSFTIEPGRVTVLMGPSGVGKSVLAAVLFGVEHSSAIQSTGALGDAAERGVLVFQKGTGFEHLTVAQNLRLTGASKAEASRLAEEFGLRPNQEAWALSGGEGRRLATAAALSADRDILWLDEPAAGLDVTRVEQLAAELRSQAATRGLAIVVTTHRAEFAAAVADRLVFLGYDGLLSEVPIAAGRDEASARTESIESEIRSRILNSQPAATSTRRRRRFHRPLWFDWAPELGLSIAGLRGAFMRGSGAWWKTFWRALKLGTLEGALFYPFVGAIFGGIFVLIFGLTLAFLDTSQVITEFGPKVVLRLSPPFAAILAAARSGSAVGSWIGQMSAARQFDALRVLGISPVRAITSAAWLGMTLSVIVGTITFAGALLGVFGGFVAADGGNGWDVVRACFTQDGLVSVLKTALYGLVVGSVTIAMARRPAERPGDVATGITSAIVLATIWVMISELVVLGLEYVQ